MINRLIWIFNYLIELIKKAGGFLISRPCKFLFLYQQNFTFAAIFCPGT